MNMLTEKETANGVAAIARHAEAHRLSIALLVMPDGTSGTVDANHSLPATPPMLPFNGVTCASLFAPLAPPKINMAFVIEKNLFTL